MHLRFSILPALVLACIAAPVSAQPSPPSADAVSKPRHLVVFNRPGENWERRAEHPDEISRHRRIYLDLAADGQIIVGGRFEGDPVLGISIFAADIDRAAIRKRLENDQLVRLGVVSLDFRELVVQMGALPKN